MCMYDKLFLNFPNFIQLHALFIAGVRKTAGNGTAVFILNFNPAKNSVKFRLFSYPSTETCVLGAQKNRLIETVLLSTHNICFG